MSTSGRPPDGTMALHTAGRAASSQTPAGAGRAVNSRSSAVVSRGGFDEVVAELSGRPGAAVRVAPPRGAGPQLARGLLGDRVASQQPPVELLRPAEARPSTASRVALPAGGHEPLAVLEAPQLRPFAGPLLHQVAGVELQSPGAHIAAADVDPQYVGAQVVVLPLRADEVSADVGVASSGAMSSSVCWRSGGSERSARFWWGSTTTSAALRGSWSARSLTAEAMWRSGVAAASSRRRTDGGAAAPAGRLASGLDPRQRRRRGRQGRSAAGMPSRDFVPWAGCFARCCGSHSRHVIGSPSLRATSAPRIAGGRFSQGGSS